jgi:hypothetical protein
MAGPASLSWCQAPIWVPRPDFYYYQTVAGLLMWGALYDERMGLSLWLLPALASAVILRSEYHRTHDHILLCQILDSPNLEGQVLVFISPRNRVVRLYPQALGSTLDVSYDLQGYGGGIRTHPTREKMVLDSPSSLWKTSVHVFTSDGSGIPDAEANLLWFIPKKYSFLNFVGIPVYRKLRS